MIIQSTSTIVRRVLIYKNSRTNPSFSTSSSCGRLERPEPLNPQIELEGAKARPKNDSNNDRAKNQKCQTGNYRYIDNTELASTLPSKRLVEKPAIKDAEPNEADQSGNAVVANTPITGNENENPPVFGRPLVSSPF
jgi:hypothetical protein